MKTRTVRALALGLALVLSTLLLGPAAVGTAAPPPPKGTLTVALPGDVNSLDPLFASSEYITTVARNFLQSPLYPNPDGTVGPQLATSWETPNDTTLILHLRRGVAFTNGEPFNAQVVKFSWQWSTRPEMRNKQYYAQISNVEIIDNYTARITLKEAQPLLLQTAAFHWYMYPPRYAQEVGPQKFGQAPIGTGPFVLQEWVKGDHLTFKANPKYYEPGRPGVETVIYRPVPEGSSRIAALQTGQVDIARGVPVEFVSPLMRARGIKVVKALSTRTYYVMFNNLGPGKGTPIENQKVRQAMNYAVNRQAIIYAVLDGQALLNNAYFGQNMFGYDPTLKPLPYDPVKAKRLLTEAGYPNGFKMTMTCPDGAYVKVREICQAITGYLNNVGVAVDLQMLESNRFWDLESKKQMPLYFDGYGSRFLDPNAQIWGAFVPDSVPGGSEWANWYDPKLVQLYNQQAHTIDRETRLRVLHEMARYMQDNPGGIWLWTPYNFEAVRSRVQNYTMYSNEVQILWDVRVTEP